MDEDITVYINNKPKKLKNGMPVSVSLYEAGYYGLYRSLKFGRVRGIRSLEWWGSERAVINGFEVNPNIRPLEEGMHIYIDNKNSMMSAFIWPFRKYFNVEFYHNFLFRSKIGWNIFTRVLNYLLPYHQPPIDDNPVRTFPRYHRVKTDVLVIGGGLSGLATAIAIAKSGLKTLLVEANSSVGGYLNNFNEMKIGESGSSKQLIDKLLKEALKYNVKLLTNVIFQGFLEDASLGFNLISGESIIFDYKAIVIATGKRDNFAVYENNDLPRSMYLSSSLKLLNKYNINPGSKGLIIGFNQESLYAAKEFKNRGIDVIIVDGKSDSLKSNSIDIKNFNIYLDVKRIVAYGKDKVEGVKFFLKDGESKYFGIDFIAYSPNLVVDTEVLSQLKIPFSFDTRIGGIVPLHSWRGETTIENVYISGSAGGLMPYEAEYYLSTGVGYHVTMNLNGKVDTSEYESSFNMGREILKKKYYPIYLAYDSLDDSWSIGKPYNHYDWRNISSVFEGDTTRMFMCPDVDITYADICYIVKELGMWRMEHIKRLSGLGTGRGQGRDCIFNTVLLVNKISGKEPIEISRFRGRYPVIPHNLYSLAGGEA